jgi:hypothetical protein
MQIAFWRSDEDGGDRGSMRHEWAEDKCMQSFGWKI